MEGQKQPPASRPVRVLGEDGLGTISIDLYRNNGSVLFVTPGFAKTESTIEDKSVVAVRNEEHGTCIPCFDVIRQRLSVNVRP
jgi:hypothetical protein